MESTFPQAASTALVNISLAWIAGVLACRFWLIKRTARWQSAVAQRLSRATTIGLAACMAAIVLSLWTESALMGDVPWLDAWPAFRDMLVSTHYGHAGIAALGILALAIAAQLVLCRACSERWCLIILSSLFALLGVARVAIGHAYEHGPFSLAVVVEWLHIVSMSLWAGIVFVAGWLALPGVLRAEAQPTTERTAFLTSMSDWAAGALVVILATGAYNAFRVLGSPADFVRTPYGNVLLLKLCLVIAAIALGGFNKFVGLPAVLQSADGQQGLRTVIAVLRVESIALLLVLAAAAVLTSSAPPGT
ncbi:copper resistance D family protein [Noviherbaspirillum massiliense]|uniref:copper resistance D family protein n=1 Tax=Noviherbaspirillum massiliense TaxID=1465823 RepID=UPI000313AB79|nr:CopD family protein [Noviherbaspirillum massiliense]